MTALAPVRLLKSNISPSGLARKFPRAQRARVVAPASADPIGNRPIPLDHVKPGELSDGYDRDQESGDLAEAVKNTRALVISIVAHLLVLIALGVYVSAEKKKPDVMVEAIQGLREPDPALEDSLDPGNNPSDQLVGEDPETLITPENLAEVDNPLAAPVASDNPNSHGDVIEPPGEGPLETITGTIRVPGIGFAPLGERIGRRRRTLSNIPGTKVTEGAVERGLAWLARHQRTDGSWSLMGPYSDGGRVENVASATAMALLAFQGHGDTPTEGKFKSNVERGWAFLLKQQDADGYFARDAQGSHRLYTQAQCSIAICELYGITDEAKYREPAERAIRYCINAQNKTLGGWRYFPGEDSDISVTGWFVMALESAKMANLEVPQESLDLVMKFLDMSQYNGGRAYYYSSLHGISPAMSAEGLLCRQYLGWKQDDVRLVEGCAELNKNPINYLGDSNIQDAYYWYYATQACHHMENPIVNGQQVPIWDDWNQVMREQVPARQVRGNKEDGSWSPVGDKWGLEGGRLYTTCLSILMLEVYYRHLPIYSGL